MSFLKNLEDDIEQMNKELIESIQGEENNPPKETLKLKDKAKLKEDEPASTENDPEEEKQEEDPEEEQPKKEEENKEEEDEDLDFPDSPPDGDNKSANNTAWKKLRLAAKQAKIDAKEKEKLLNELQVKVAKLEGYTSGKGEPANKEQVVPEDVEPDRVLDPEEWIEWKFKQRDKEIEVLKSQLQQQNSQSFVQQAKEELSALEQNYAKDNKITDYQDRIDHIMRVKRNEIKMMYPSASDIQINQHLEMEKLRVASALYNQGINPAEKFIEMADGYGYVSKSKNTPAKPKPKTVNIDEVNRNMQKNRSFIGMPSEQGMPRAAPEDVVNASISKLLKNPEMFESALQNLE